MEGPPINPFLEPWQRTLQTQVRGRSVGLEPGEEENGEAPAGAALAARVRALELYRYLVPASHGGERPAVELRTLCLLREALAYRSGAADALFAVQGLGCHPILLAGDESQQRAWLPKVAAGESLFAFALTEPEAGSDVGALESSARREGDHYVLNGEKRLITNAPIATHFTLFARTAAGRGGVSAFVVTADAPGLAVQPQTALLAPHPLSGLTLKDCRVPAGARLGPEGAGMKLALATLERFRVAVGAAAVGLAQRALDEAVAYARTRRQFGAPLAQLESVRALLADSAVELEAARLMVYCAAAAADGGAARIPFHSSAAKLFATEAAQRIVDRCLQVHGGNGVVKGFAVERLYREVRALRLYEGASEVQRALVARQLLESDSGQSSPAIEPARK